MTTSTIHQSGGANLGNENSFERIDTVNANTISTQIVVGSGVSLDEVQRTVRRDQERPQRWLALVDQLCGTSLEIGAEAICCLYAALWPDEKLPDLPAAPGSTLFQAMMLARREKSAQVDQNVPAFVAAMARLGGELVRARLQPWLVRALDELGLDAAQHERLVTMTLDSYARLAATRPSLLVEIKKARAAGTQPLYNLRVAVMRPNIGTRLLFPNHDHEHRDMNLAEIKRLVFDLRRSAAMLPWAQGKLTIELLLPVKLILELKDEWRFEQWSYEESWEIDGETISKRRWLDKEHPLVVRWCDRRKQVEALALWEGKSRYLTKWIGGELGDSTPSILSFNANGLSSVKPEDWEKPDTVALVITEPIDPYASLDRDHWLMQVIFQGLPVAIWPLPGADAGRCCGFLDRLDAAALRDLPERLRKARSRPDQAVPATDLVLFWDDYDRRIPEAPLRNS